MAIDWNRFRFLCDVDDFENVYVYPTDDVRSDMDAMGDEFFRARKLLPRCRLIPADFGHRPGIAVWFSQRLTAPLVNIAETLNGFSDKILVEGMETPVAKQGNPNDEEH